MPGRRLPARLIFLPLLLLRCGCAGPPVPSEDAAAAGPPLVYVREAKLFSEPVLIPADGTAVAGRMATLSAPFTAEVLDVRAERGTRVAASEPVVQLDAGAAEEQLAAARLELAAAEISLRLLEERLRAVLLGRTALELSAERRARSLASAEEQLRRAGEEAEAARLLVEAGSLPEKRLEDSRAAFDEARRQAENIASLLQADRLELFEPPQEHPETAIARLNVELGNNRVSECLLETGRCRNTVEEAAVTAPFDAVVLSVHKYRGERVSAGEPLISLYDPLSAEISALLPLSDLPFIEPGCAAAVEGQADSKVSRIIATSGGAGMAEVRIAAPPGAGPLIPGAPFRITIRSPKRITGVLLSPEIAQRHEGSKTAVYIVEEGRCYLREVSVSDEITGKRVITGGVREGELICLSVPPRFQNGMEVTCLLEEEP